MNQRTRTDRPKVLLLIPHLGGGGAEAVIALLASGISAETFDVHLGLITSPAPPTAAISRHVTVHTLKASRVRYAAVGLLALIRRLRPQLIVSGMYHLNFLVLLLRPFFPRPIQVVVRQNGSVSAVLASDEAPTYTRLLYRLLYRRADCIICQSHAMASDLIRALGVPATRVVVLHNPVDVDALRNPLADAHPHWPSNGPHLLAVGRLSHEKGFDLLLEALARVRKSIPNVDLVIAGSGKEEAALHAQCKRLGLESAVCFAGHVSRPAVYFAATSAFVLSSRHEGMPNALLEAAAAGLPIVAVPAAGGVEELLRGHPGTWLSTEISADALAVSIIEALRSLRQAERFTHAFIEPFRMEPAIRAYEAVISATIQGGRR